MVLIEEFASPAKCRTRMRIRSVCQLVLLVLMLVAVFQNVLTASAQNSSENITPVSENNTSTSVAQLINVQGIWNVSLAGTGITVAVNQSGDSIYGRCKFEGAEPWNGAVAGSLSGNSINIAIAAMQGKVLVSTDITGTISDDVLLGRYVSYGNNGNETNGEVTGTRISPDVADYTSVKIKAEATAEQLPASTPALVQQPVAVQLAQANAAQDNQATKSRFKDVTQMARGINANVLPWSFPL
jgi:hypothetical protein